MRTTLRVSLAAACAAGLGGAPAATGVDTVVRVEGGTSTLVPESAIPIEGTGTATVFDKNFASVDVGRGTAFWQLVRATSTGGIDLSFEYFAAFDAVLVQKVGPDANAGSAGWQYRVNHVAPPVGASAQALAQGDSVLWYFGASDGARELDVTPSSDRVATGGTFTVRVTSYAADGAAAPGAGAVVRYGSATATADAAGTATFVGQGTGPQPVQATRAGDIRSASRTVCAYGADPTVCNLPAAPAAPSAPGGGTAAAADTVAPGSRIIRPALGKRARSVRVIRGVAGPDRSDVKGVEVALARRVGTQCRFRVRSGGMTKARACSRPVFVAARSVGTNWALPVGKGLAPGTWRVWSRSTDGAGNRESLGLARVNTGTFTVGRARR
ncbi:MAG: DUF4430 domain-containing protein [Thermoleophilia bacterium]